MNTQRHTTPYLSMTIVVLSLIGFLDALYLSIERLTPAPIPCLAGVANSCESLQNSPYSLLLGIPVAYLGVVWYVVMFVLGLVATHSNRLRKRAYTGMIIAIAGAVPFELYLVGVMIYLRQYCYWCLASAGIVFAMLPLTLSAKYFRR